MGRHQHPIVIGGVQVSHLAIRLDEAPEPQDAELCGLYLHGFASSQSGEKVDFFRRRFRRLGLPFCSFDFQGHGESGGEMVNLSLSRNIADIGQVCGFLADSGYRRLVLFGSSMGGASGLWYAALHPEAVAATISIAPALDMQTTLLTAVGPELAASWQQEGRIALEHPLGVFDLDWGLIEDLRSHGLDRLCSNYRVPGLIFQGKKRCIRRLALGHRVCRPL